MFPQYGELRPTSGWDRLTSLGYPCKFQLVSRLSSVTARHLVVGVSQTLRRWTEGATRIRQGDHHVGHWPTFLVGCISLKLAEWPVLCWVIKERFLANVLSPVRLSVWNVRAPCSGGSNFRQYFYGIRYLGHPLTSTENFTEIVPGEPLRWGS